ncbi:MAG: PIG-L family deacetylase [Clostridia bacterium]|nr:PIG-L family deacetylase [Clostridia bacterium]
MRKIFAFLLALSLLAPMFALAEGRTLTLIDMDELSFPFLLDSKSVNTLSGEIKCVSPMKSVTLTMYDIRQLKEVFSNTYTFNVSDGIFTFSASRFKGLIAPQIKPGEYTFTVTVSDSTGNTASREFISHVLGNGFPVIKNMNADCVFSTDARVTAFGFLSDNNIDTYTTPANPYTLNITLPEGRSAAYLCTEWCYAPTDLRLTQYDGNGSIISETEDKNPKGMVALNYAIDENARRLSLYCGSPNSRLGELYVLEKDQVSPSALLFEEMPEKVDLMVFSTHQDDELLFLGGTIPYYAEQGKTVCVVYMARCMYSTTSFRRIIEALNGLNWCGVKYHPIFLNHKDGHCPNMAHALYVWGGEALYDEVTELIRHYKPEVIVTQDINGEYGHLQHQLTSLAVRTAVEMAADPECCPESLEKYGTWETKKLYIHLYEENELTMDVYAQPMKNYLGLTATQVSKLAYSKHYSQWFGCDYDEYNRRWNNSKYGLYYTSVGPDVNKNDFFENVD